MKTIDELTVTLRQHALRFRTGIIVSDQVDIISLDPIHLRLQSFIVDYHEVVLTRLSPNARVVPIDPFDVLRDLKDIATKEGPSPIALVVNLDLALSKLSHDQVARFWDDYGQLLPFSTTAVVSVLPTNAVSILPSGRQLEDWKTWGRIAFT